jgi:hypothetical protein
LVAWFIIAFWPNDQKAVRRHLEKAAHWASFNRTESALARVSVAGKLAAMCTADVAFNLSGLSSDIGSIHGRDQLREVIIATRSVLTSLTVRLYDLQIQITPDRTHSTVLLTAIADVNGERNANVQELRFSLEREPDGWRIAQIETVKALGR